MKQYLKRTGWYKLYFENGVVLQEKMSISDKRSKAREELYTEEWAKILSTDKKYVESALRKIKVGDTYEIFLEYIQVSKQRFEKLANDQVVRDEMEVRIQNKELSVEELVGTCRFEFDFVQSGSVNNKVLNRISVNFLIPGNYTFEDIKPIEKEIFDEVCKRLQANSRFEKYNLKMGYYSGKMVYINKPKSINVTFTVKKELLN